MSKKVVVITGASTGFGHLTAKQLAARGHRVFATMRNIDGTNRSARDELLAYAKQHHHELHVVDLDVTHSSSVDRAIGDVLSAAGHIDVLVNNAGVMNIGVTEAFTLEQVQAQLEVNFFASIRTARAVLPSMRKRGSGLLVHVSSAAGRLVFPFFGVYCASKYAVEALAEAYRYELRPFGIDSVIVEPGPFGTELLPRSPAPADDDRVQAYGDVAKVADGLKGGFKQLYESPAPPQPADVVAAIARLVEQTDRRPFRTVVMPQGMDFGLADINAVSSKTQEQLLRSLQLDQFL